MDPYLGSASALETIAGQRERRRVWASTTSLCCSVTLARPFPGLRWLPGCPAAEGLALARRESSADWAADVEDGRRAGPDIPKAICRATGRWARTPAWR